MDSLKNDSSNIHLAVETHASLVNNNIGWQNRFNQVLLHELLILLVQHDIFWFANQILTIIRHFWSFRVLEEHLLLIEYFVLRDSRVHHWDAFFWRKPSKQSYLVGLKSVLIAQDFLVKLIFVLSVLVIFFLPLQLGYFISVNLRW